MRRPVSLHSQTSYPIALNLEVMKLLFNLIVLILLAIVCRGEEDKEWCKNGSITKTTNECICPTHKGMYCLNSESNPSVDEKLSCQSGFGMSFYHKDASTCECTLSDAWVERLKARKKGSLDSTEKYVDRQKSKVLKGGKKGKRRREEMP